MLKIEFNDYTKVIKKKSILTSINYIFEEGKIYKLEGPNGGGKTMLLRAIAGLIYPTNGMLTVDGVEITAKNEYPVKIGALIENPVFWKNYTGLEVLKYLANIRGEITVEEIKTSMERMGLDPNDKRNIGKYSLGMRQKLGIVQAIMEKPDILLLDEPVNALDGNAIELLKRIILEEKNRGAVIVIAIHNSGDFAVDYDEIIRIEEGHIVNE